MLARLRNWLQLQMLWDLDLEQLSHSIAEKLYAASGSEGGVSENTAADGEEVIDAEFKEEK